MTGGRLALIVGGSLAGVFFLSRLASGASSISPVPPPPAGGPKVTGGPLDLGPGVPGLGPIYNALKPLQGPISTGLGRLNSALGGTDMYAKPTNLVKQANGDYTGQQGGATVTFHPDGTITRKANGVRTVTVIKNVGSAIGGAASSAGHFIGGLF